MEALYLHHLSVEVRRLTTRRKAANLRRAMPRSLSHHNLHQQVIGKDVLKMMRVINDKATADAVSVDSEMNKHLLASQQRKSPEKPSEKPTSSARAFRDENLKVGSKAVPPKVPAITVTPIPPGVVPVGL